MPYQCPDTVSKPVHIRGGCAALVRNSQAAQTAQLIPINVHNTTAQQSAISRSVTRLSRSKSTIISYEQKGVLWYSGGVYGTVYGTLPIQLVDWPSFPVSVDFPSGTQPLRISAARLSRIVVFRMIILP